MTIMYDTVGDKAHSIPAHPEIVAGYIDGSISIWTQAEWDLFPNAKKLHISVLANDQADTFDQEAGNASATSVAQAVKRRQDRGQRSVIYCSQSRYQVQVAETNRAGVNRSSWDAWLANWSNGPHIPAHAVGVQYLTNDLYDTSFMDPTWVASYFGETPTPVPTSTSTHFDTLGEILNMSNLDTNFVAGFLHRFLLHQDLAADPKLHERTLKALNGGQSLGSVFAAIQASPEGQHVLKAERKALGLDQNT